jgi:acetolactate synthase I/II/III large subunit
MVKLAQAYGLPATCIESDRDFPRLAGVLDAPGPALCRVCLDPAQEFEPRLKSRQLPDGSIVSPSLEDMYPFLEHEEVESNLLMGQEA